MNDVFFAITIDFFSYYKSLKLATNMLSLLILAKYLSVFNYYYVSQKIFFMSITEYKIINLEGFGSDKLLIFIIVLSIKHRFHKSDEYFFHFISSVFSKVKYDFVADNFSSVFKIFAMVCLMIILTSVSFCKTQFEKWD
jgi:hypothetical protein